MQPVQAIGLGMLAVLVLELIGFAVRRFGTSPRASRVVARMLGGARVLQTVVLLVLAGSVWYVDARDRYHAVAALGFTASVAAFGLIARLPRFGRASDAVVCVLCVQFLGLAIDIDSAGDSWAARSAVAVVLAGIGTSAALVLWAHVARWRVTEVYRGPSATMLCAVLVVGFAGGATTFVTGRAVIVELSALIAGVAMALAVSSEVTTRRQR